MIGKKIARALILLVLASVLGLTFIGTSIGEDPVNASRMYDPAPTQVSQFIVGDDSDPGDAYGDLSVWNTSDLSEDSGQVSGLWVVRYGNPSSSYAGTLEGADITAAVPSGNSQDFTNSVGGVRGAAAAVVHGGSGDITQAEGVATWIDQPGTGDITQANGIHVFNARSTGSGTIGTQVGLSIDNLTTGTYNVGIDIQGASTLAMWVHEGAVLLEGILAAKGAYVEMIEQSEPSAPAADGVRVFARDNGSGKTQLCAKFNTGAIQCFATQP